MEEIKEWRRDALKMMEERYEKWLIDCQSSIKEQEIKIEELEQVMVAANELESSEDVIVLQVYVHLC